MKLLNLKLINFRNYSSLDLSFNKDTQIFFGDNGQGKTNIVEAIYFLSLLKSFKDEEKTHLIKKGEEFAKIEAIVQTTNTKKNLKVVINKEGTNLFIDNEKENNKNEFISLVNTICFIPRESFLFKDPPKVRREFLDDEIVKLSPAYAMALKEYNKVLKERNELLHYAVMDKHLLEVLSRKLADLNVEIASRRYAFIDRLNTKLSQIYSSISQKEETFELEYVSLFAKDQLEASVIYKQMMDGLEEDKKRQVTTIGIHKDDFKGLLNKDDISLFGSQGQQRMGVIALKLVLIKQIEERSGEKPIVILDDVLSELDNAHQQSLISHFENKNQLFITVSSLDSNIIEELKKKGEIYKISVAKVQKEKI